MRLTSTEAPRTGAVDALSALRAHGQLWLVLPAVGRSRGRVGEEENQGCFVKGSASGWRSSEFRLRGMMCPSQAGPAGPEFGRHGEVEKWDWDGKTGPSC